MVEIDPDILYVHEIFNAAFFLSGFLRLRPRIIDAHGSPGLEYASYGHGREARRVQLWERFSLNAADGVITASQGLATYLTREHGLDPDRVFVVPNGVPQSFLESPSQRAEARRRYGFRDSLVVLLSAPPYIANDFSVEFMESVTRILRGRRLAFNVVVTGRSNAPEGMTPLGIVKDYMGLIDASDVAVLPYPAKAVVGGGRNKALEFLARGKAIVSTKEGVRGIDQAKPYIHFLPAETPAEFASAIQFLAENPESRQSLGLASRQLAREFAWSRSATRLSEIFERLARAG